MTGSPIFSVNFTDGNNPAKPDYQAKQSSEMYWEYGTAGHLVFSTPWPAVELKNVLVSQNMVSFSEPSVNQMLDWLFFINMGQFRLARIFQFCEIYGEHRTAGHLVFRKPWPAVKLKKVVSQNEVSSSEPSVNQTLHLRSGISGSLHFS